MRNPAPPRGRSFPLLVRQRGQALAFIGVTTVVVLLGLLLLYNVAQLTTQKMKLQNTADAAAYSGAVTEARDYNFTAYANRAMIANQVAVAQIVGLRSWARKGLVAGQGRDQEAHGQVQAADQDEAEVDRKSVV